MLWNSTRRAVPVTNIKSLSHDALSARLGHLETSLRAQAQPNERAKHNAAMLSSEELNSGARGSWRRKARAPLCLVLHRSSAYRRFRKPSRHNCGRTSRLRRSPCRHSRLDTVPPVRALGEALARGKRRRQRRLRAATQGVPDDVSQNAPRCSSSRRHEVRALGSLARRLPGSPRRANDPPKKG